MNYSRKLIAAAVISVLPLSAAMAEDNGDMQKQNSQRSGQDFSRLDTNKDGRVSRAEAAADATIVWAGADTNGDGYIDTAEWAIVPADKNRQNSQKNSPQSNSSQSSAPPKAQQGSSQNDDTSNSSQDQQSPKR